MEESAKKEATESTVVSFSYSPCNLLEEALAAFLKCLGFESTKPDEDSSRCSQKKDDKAIEGSSQDPPSASDPPPTAGEDASKRVLPRIGSGSGPQIN